eukprot:SM000044S15973  [mRNA]  locus=s44:300793:305193:+ [translate_table: standard]
MPFANVPLLSAPPQGPPIVHAAEAGNEYGVKLLLLFHADVNARDAHNNTALHIAAARGHRGVVLMLLGAQASRSMRNKDFRLAEDLAKTSGVRALLRQRLNADREDVMLHPLPHRGGGGGGGSGGHYVGGSGSGDLSPPLSPPMHPHNNMSAGGGGGGASGWEGRRFAWDDGAALNSLSDGDGDSDCGSEDNLDDRVGLAPHHRSFGGGGGGVGMGGGGHSSDDELREPRSAPLHRKSGEGNGGRPLWQHQQPQQGARRNGTGKRQHFATVAGYGPPAAEGDAWRLGSTLPYVRFDGGLSTGGDGGGSRGSVHRAAVQPSFSKTFPYPKHQPQDGEEEGFGSSARSGSRVQQHSPDWVDSNGSGHGGGTEHMAPQRSLYRGDRLVRSARDHIAVDDLLGSGGSSSSGLAPRRGRTSSELDAAAAAAVRREVERERERERDRAYFEAAWNQQQWQRSERYGGGGGSGGGQRQPEPAGPSSTTEGAAVQGRHRRRGSWGGSAEASGVTDTGGPDSQQQLGRTYEGASGSSAGPEDMDRAARHWQMRVLDNRDRQERTRERERERDIERERQRERERERGRDQEKERERGQDWGREREKESAQEQLRSHWDESSFINSASTSRSTRSGSVSVRESMLPPDLQSMDCGAGADMPASMSFTSTLPRPPATASPRKLSPRQPPAIAQWGRSASASSQSRDVEHGASGSGVGELQLQDASATSASALAEALDGLQSLSQLPPGHRNEADLACIRPDWREAARANACVACSKEGCDRDCLTTTTDAGSTAVFSLSREESARALAAPLPNDPAVARLLTTTEVTAEAHTKAGLRWTRGHLLGEGAYGKVYMGLDQSTGKLMAVKQLKLQESSEKAAHLAALEREIELYKQMRHEHIVGYIDMERDEATDSLYVFLEYASGGSIHSMLEKFGIFSESLVRVYTRQLLLGLEYLHAQNIIHRDIKGGNVLVDCGIVKLADFGASKAHHEGTITDGCKSIRGSVFWMAPEVIKAAGYGRRADIWSVGGTVIEMLTGMHPWPEIDNTWSAIFQIAKTQTGPPIPPNCSSEAKDFLSLCFKLDPTKRPTASELLAHPFVANVESSSSDSGSRSEATSSLHD